MVRLERNHGHQMTPYLVSFKIFPSILFLRPSVLPCTPCAFHYNPQPCHQPPDGPATDAACVASSAMEGSHVQDVRCCLRGLVCDGRKPCTRCTVHADKCTYGALENMSQGLGRIERCLPPPKKQKTSKERLRTARDVAFPTILVELVICLLCVVLSLPAFIG